MTKLKNEETIQRIRKERADDRDRIKIAWRLMDQIISEKKHELIEISSFYKLKSAQGYSDDCLFDAVFNKFGETGRDVMNWHRYNMFNVRRIPTTYKDGTIGPTWEECQDDD